MRVMILGANGMLGFALKQVLRFEDVRAFGRKQLDITDADKVAKKLHELRPDYCINLAAMTNVDQCEVNVADATLTNGHALGHLAIECKKHEVRLIQISTDYVFGQHTKDGFLESDEPRDPVNAYGNSKLLGESLVQRFAEKYYIIRTAWVFGPGGNNFIDKVFKLARLKGELTIVDDIWGSPTYTFDLARVIHHLIRTNRTYGIYHFVNSGLATWHILAQTALRMAGMNHVPINPVPSDSNRVRTYAKRPENTVLLNIKGPKLRHWRLALQEYLIGIGELKKHK